MERIVKSIQIQKEDLEKINQYTRRELKEEEVYTFSVVLCDNEIDRDGEAFTPNALKGLAKLFLGKTGIFDHDPKGQNQSARIYNAEVVQSKNKMTSYGTPYYFLQAQAYMVRNARCDDLILEIDAGIKKEVSVGCSMNKRFCSICGAPLGNGCAHVKGKRYNGKICYTVMDEPSDAYEWSFVAIPAQRAAGVVKRHSTQNSYGKKVVSHTQEGDISLKEYVNRLEKQAIAGKRYLDYLRGEVIRLGFLTDCGLAEKTVASLANKMDIEELESFKKELDEKMAKKSLSPQLFQQKKEQTDEINHQFRI